MIYGSVMLTNGCATCYDMRMTTNTYRIELYAVSDHDESDPDPRWESESDNVDDLMTRANMIVGMRGDTFDWQHVDVDHNGDSVYNVYRNTRHIAVAIVIYPK